MREKQKMIVCCLDLEGVLVPEIWIEFSKKTGLEELRYTTRDIPDYDVLMQRRLKILRKNKLKLKDIQQVIRRMDPLPGAKQFLDSLRARHQTILLSDTFEEFAQPLMKKLGWPSLFCNFLEIGREGFVSGYHLRQKNGKEKAARALKAIGFQVRAAGDSYNDITMLKASDRGVLFNPPPKIAKDFGQFKTVKTYSQLLRELTR